MCSFCLTGNALVKQNGVVFSTFDNFHTSNGEKYTTLLHGGFWYAIYAQDNGAFLTSSSTGNAGYTKLTWNYKKLSSARVSLKRKVP